MREIHCLLAVCASWPRLPLQPGERCSLNWLLSLASECLTFLFSSQTRPSRSGYRKAGEKLSFVVEPKHGSTNAYKTTHFNSRASASLLRNNCQYCRHTTSRVIYVHWLYLLFKSNFCSLSCFVCCAISHRTQCVLKRQLLSSLYHRCAHTHDCYCSTWQWLSPSQGGATRKPKNLCQSSLLQSSRIPQKMAFRHWREKLSVHYCWCSL
jgi:hypothetical protein